MNYAQTQAPLHMHQAGDVPSHLTRSVPNSLAPAPVGAGALSTGGAIGLGLVLAIAGGIGGGMLGARFSKKHQVGATIAGTLLGTWMIPAIVGPIVLGAAGGVEGVNTKA